MTCLKRVLLHGVARSKTRSPRLHPEGVVLLLSVLLFILARLRLVTLSVALSLGLSGTPTFMMQAEQPEADRAGDGRGTDSGSERLAGGNSWLSIHSRRKEVREVCEAWCVKKPCEKVIVFCLTTFSEWQKNGAFGASYARTSTAMSQRSHKSVKASSHDISREC